MIFTRRKTRKRSNIRKMERVLASLDYDFSDFSLMAFLEWLGQQHNTQLWAVGKKMPQNIFGAWIATSDAHYFFYDNQLSGLHQTHVILHELSHWLCGHPTIFVATEQILAQKPHLIAIDKTLGYDGHYSKKQEQEAETLALLIGEKVARLKQKQSNGNKRDQAVQRFCQSLNLI